MRFRISSTWLSVFLVIVALGRPAAPAPTAQEVGSVPYDPELWSPANPTAGGIVFLVNPADAQVYVDGSYAGRPLQFSPARPLRVGAGQHRIELIAVGYATTRIDLAVLPGFVVSCDVVMEKR